MHGADMDGTKSGKKRRKMESAATMLCPGFRRDIPAREAEQREHVADLVVLLHRRPCRQCVLSTLLVIHTSIHTYTRTALASDANQVTRVRASGSGGLMGRGNLVGDQCVYLVDLIPLSFASLSCLLLLCHPPFSSLVIYTPLDYYSLQTPLASPDPVILFTLDKHFTR